jgi:hypothetical protein
MGTVGMLPQEEIDEQLQLLHTYRRTLATYLRQQAAIGEAYSPPALLFGITEARSHIQRIKSVLRAAGVEVPDDVDDEEPAPILIVPRIPKRARAGLVVGAIGAALLLVIGLAIGSFSGLLPQGAEPATPLASIGTVATSAGSAASPPGYPAPTTQPAAAAPFAEYTFARGTAEGWNGEPEQWQIVQDDAGFAYQAQASVSAVTAATPPDFDRINSLQNYAVEMRVKIVQAGVPHSDYPDIWLSLRAQPDPVKSCESYNFRLWQTDHSATIYLGGPAAGCELTLASGQANLEIGRWHAVRAEVNGTQLKFFVDGTLAVSATDTALSQGFFYVSIGPGATVQLADVRIYKL